MNLSPSTLLPYLRYSTSVWRKVSQPAATQSRLNSAIIGFFINQEEKV